MKKKYIVSLITEKNDYQREQATAAETVSRRLGVELEILYADGDAITQSQQLLMRIQTSSGPLPDGIVCQPVGTGLVHVATAAVKAGIGWAVLNRDVDYVPQLWQEHKVPILAVGLDQEEVGRIQGRQFGALLREGGMILYIQGPAINPVVEARTRGMIATKPDTVQVRMMRGRWTEESGFETVSSWLTLATSRQTPIRLVGSQNDAMAMGARRAFQGTTGVARQWWAALPFTGCDACPGKGQEWVRSGSMAASVLIPPTAGIALEKLVTAFQSGVPPSMRAVVDPESFPPIDKLVKR